MPPTPLPGTAAPGDAPLWKGGRGSQESCDADRQSGKTKTHEKAEGRKKLAFNHAFWELVEEIKINTNSYKFLQSCHLRAHVRLGVFQVRLCLAKFLPANYISSVLSFRYKYSEQTYVC